MDDTSLSVQEPVETPKKKRLSLGVGLKLFGFVLMLVGIPVGLFAVKNGFILPKAAPSVVLCKAFTDTFSTSPYDKTKWRVSPDAASVSVSGGTLLISHSVTKTTTLSYAPGGKDYALGSNFEVSVDLPAFTGTTAGNYQSLKFKATGTTNKQYQEVRRTVKNGRTYLQSEVVVDSAGTNKKFKETEVTGTNLKVKIKRSGSTATAYYQSSTKTSWTQFNSVSGVYTGTGNATIRLATNASTKVDAKFDNFVIGCIGGTGGGVVKPPVSGIPSAQCTEYPQVPAGSSVSSFDVKLSQDEEYLVATTRNGLINRGYTKYFDIFVNDKATPLNQSDAYYFGRSVAFSDPLKPENGGWDMVLSGISSGASHFGIQRVGFNPTATSPGNLVNYASWSPTSGLVNPPTITNVEAMVMDPAGKLYLSARTYASTSEPVLFSCTMSLLTAAHDTDTLDCTEWTTASSQTMRVTGMAANSNYVYVVSNDAPGQSPGACTSTTNSKIVVINSATGDIASTYTAGLNCPLDIDIDSAGYLYVADRGLGSILKLSTDNGSSITSVLATIPNIGAATGISVDASGNKIFVTDAGASVTKKLMCLDRNRAPQTDPVGFWKFDDPNFPYVLTNNSPSLNPEYPLTLSTGGLTIVTGHGGGTGNSARSNTDITQRGTRYAKDSSFDPLQYLRPSNDQQLTVMAWVKHQAGDPANYMSIVSYSNMKLAYPAVDAFTTGYGLYANKNAANGPIGYGFFIKDMTNRVTYPTTFDTDWHHVAAVYDGSTSPKTMMLYVDGAAGSTVNSTLPLVYETVAGFQPPQFTTVTALTLSYGGYGNFAFYGTIDDVRMYNRALPASEIAVIFGGTIPTNTPTPVVTNTPIPTNTPVPTATLTPTPTPASACLSLEAGYDYGDNIIYLTVIGNGQNVQVTRVETGQVVSSGGFDINNDPPPYTFYGVDYNAASEPGPFTYVARVDGVTSTACQRSFTKWW